MHLLYLGETWIFFLLVWVGLHHIQDVEYPPITNVYSFTPNQDVKDPPLIKIQKTHTASGWRRPVPRQKVEDATLTKI